jgi:hypothetical protein
MDEPRRIINTYDQMKAAGGDGVAICVAHSGGRGSFVSGWHVVRFVRGKTVATDPDAAYYHDKQKWFSLVGSSGRDGFVAARAAALAQAQAWVKAQGWYDGEWKRNAMGDFVPADVQRQFPIKRPRRASV